MRLRVRAADGSSATIAGLDAATATIGELKSRIREVAKLEGDFAVKAGYPPVLLNDDVVWYNEDARIDELSVKIDGSQLMVDRTEGTGGVQRGSGPAPSDTSSTQSKHNSTGPLSLQKKERKQDPNDPPEVSVPALNGTLVLRVMPDDNSCLFRALSAALLGSLDSMHELRSQVAQAIRRQPEIYNSAVLEKSPADYCRWIQTETSWGGAIEIGILAQEFGVEICSINVQDGRVDRFNEDPGRRFCVVIYSGIHYDVLALTPNSSLPFDLDQRVFDSKDREILLQAAQNLCNELRQSHYYTDTTGFSVKCNTCGWVGKGEKEALKHAQATSHAGFGEA